MVAFLHRQIPLLAFNLTSYWSAMKVTFPESKSVLVVSWSTSCLGFTISCLLEDRFSSINDFTASQILRTTLLAIMVERLLLKRWTRVRFLVGSNQLYKNWYSQLDSKTDRSLRFLMAKATLVNKHLQRLLENCPDIRNGLKNILKEKSPLGNARHLR